MPFPVFLREGVFAAQVASLDVADPRPRELSHTSGTHNDRHAEDGSERCHHACNQSATHASDAHTF